MRRYFLTGCTGWLGQFIVAELLRRADTEHICLLTRDPHRGQRFRLMDERISLYVGDITTCVMPKPSFSDIIHGANGAYHDPFPLESYYATVEGTRRVLQWAKAHDITSILLLSSGAAATCDVPYGQAKATAELLLQSCGAYQAKIARIYALVGDDTPEHYAIGKFISDAVHRRQVTVMGGRNVIRSYLHVEDCARWLLTILDKAPAHMPYSVGGDVSYNIVEAAYLVGSVFGVPVREVYGEFAPSTYLPILPATFALGCQRTINLPMALERIRDRLLDVRNPDLQQAGAS